VTHRRRLHPLLSVPFAGSGLLVCLLSPAPCLAQAATTDPATAASTTGSIADAVGLKLSLRSGAWTQDRELGSDDLTVVGGLRGRLAPRFSPVLDGFAEGYVQTDSARGTRANLTEGWVRLSSGTLELRAGRQIIVWGRADRLNPTDNLGGRDYTLLTASDDDQRQGPLTVLARWGSGNWTFDGLWLPEFRPDRYPLDRQFPGVTILPDAQPRDAGQFAAKLDNSGGNLDFSLSYFDGIDRTRDFVPVSQTSPIIQQQFPRIRVIGADLAGAAGPVGYRAEAAVTFVRGLPGVFRKQSNFWLVAGFDTPAPGGWNLNLQYSYRHVFGWRDPQALANPIARGVAQLDAAVTNQLDRDQHGATVRLARSWLSETLDFELASIVYFTRGDAAIRPRLGYRINDNLRLSLGADLFVGPSLSYFGRVRSLSGGWLQLTSGF